MILCIILVDIEEKGVKNMKEREIKMDKKRICRFQPSLSQGI